MAINAVRSSACWVDLSDVEIYDTSADEQVEAVA